MAINSGVRAMVDIFNPNPARVMHIDLNSCFASIEQQSRPLLRGRPVVIVNRATEHTAIVTASYEAKAKGIQALMKLREARSIVPDIVAIESDPAKYRFVYRKLLAIMQDYSAHVTMKSIDEGVIDFHQAPEDVVDKGLVSIGHEIKQRLRDEVGVAMRCNVGISTNRFLAKMAASLHKPDGLDVITANNIREVFSTLKLTDLTGIAYRNEARLNAVGIYTPIEFLDTGEDVLRRMVFKGVNGTHWYQRLRGYEVDDHTSEVGRVGRQYVLERFDLSYEDILRRLHHLCESVGWRMRRQGLVARGVYVYAKTNSGYWHACRVYPTPIFSNKAIYEVAQELFRNVPGEIREIGMHCYKLQKGDAVQQLGLFADEINRERSLVRTTDEVNGRYGERTIVAADTINTGIYISQKIPFGSTRYL